jgi:hypothetical protein
MKALRKLFSDSGFRISGVRILAAAAFVAALCSQSSMAFPPAPHHTLYGTVRDQMGEPLVVTNAEVILETLAGVQLKTMVVPNLKPGANYRLQVPMDAGVTADAYKPTALRPTVAFRLKVRIGSITYLPIEVAANYSNLGKPAQNTQLDLTLGEDTDADGLPDAWEQAVIIMLGNDLTLQDIRPDDDADGDGISNLQEYLAGTYAFDPEDGFRLEIVGHANGNPVLEFLAIRSRSYALEASSDLKTWVPAQFRLLTDAPDSSWRDCYQATDVHFQHLEALPPYRQPGEHLFYRAKLQ